MDNYYSASNDFETILQRMMEHIPDTMDKQEGSVAYNFLAPFAAELAMTYADMDRFMAEQFADTASREGLERRCSERGLYPQEATASIVLGVFTPTSIDVTGERFSHEGINFIVVEATDTAGEYRLQCETDGVDGNVTGTIVPIDTIPGLQTATIDSVLIPGEDEESDEALLSRYIESFTAYDFGGNISDYRNTTNAISGVGATKVYPVWNGGGTVKVAIIGADYAAPTPAALISTVQEELDPLDSQGEGVGTAPIGHTVTVVGVTAQTINVTATLTFGEDSVGNAYVLADVLETIKDVLDEYYLELRQTWADSTSTTIRISQIESRILGIEGILDIDATTINGTAANLTLGENILPIGGTFNGL